MSDVTSILSAIESGDPLAAEQLLPLVYDELRKLGPSSASPPEPAPRSRGQRRASTDGRPVPADGPARCSTHCCQP
ncbi:MAG TPA: ECF-type sigma factor, partial [Planctomycetaceae bacterium]|nr:ECF-type sigma factor [Planctomycetaceae bacterium]